jgi:hypothetical protein
MRKRRAVGFGDLAKRLTGISTPVFGVSWTPPESERDIVRGLIAFLEDRRVLYADYNREYGPWVDRSVLQIRGELTRLLVGRPAEDSLGGALRGMRAACRKYLNATGEHASEGHRPSILEPQLWVALGELRATFGVYLARLCASFGIDLSADLASILPSEDQEAA